MSGIDAQRGFIYQSLIAMIECMERNDWDAIKLEPKTEADKVDIKLYKNDETLTAIQVKTTKNSFSEPEVKMWHEEVRADASDAKEVCLCLVGDSFSSQCDKYIKNNNTEIIKAPFMNLEALCLGKLTQYVTSKGLASEVLVSNLDLIDASIFSQIHRNSISSERLSREAFEEAFRRALHLHSIPKCLTSIPVFDKNVGLVGRKSIVNTVNYMLDKDSRLVLVSGLGGIGKTAVMQWVCNYLKNNGNYVAWIDCGRSLKEDLLTLTDAFGISVEDPEIAYKMVLSVIRARFDGSLYLFMDNLDRRQESDELKDLNSLNAHIMVTSRQKHNAFPSIDLEVLESEDALSMFFKYYNGDTDRQYEEDARKIVASVNRHTLLVELLAKAAWKTGGTLKDFSDSLACKGVYEVFDRKLKVAHEGDKNRTIEECILKLYEISNLSPEQQRIMKLFSILTPEKEIYWKLSEWAGLEMNAVDELVDLAWLSRSGQENNFKIHKIINDSLKMQMEKSGDDLRIEDYGNLINEIADINYYMPEELEYTKMCDRLVLAQDIADYLIEKINGLTFSKNLSEDRKEFLGKAAILYHNIATKNCDQGKYEKALVYFGKALAIKEGMLGPYNPSTAMTYNNIAKVFAEQGEYEKALDYNQKALSIRERVLGQEHPDTTSSYNNIAMVYLDQGKYENALHYFRNALDILKREIDQYYKDVAITYNNMGMVYHYQGKYENARHFFWRAMAICERKLDPNNPLFVNLYNNLGRVYDIQGKYDRALQYYGNSLAIGIRIISPNHPIMATIYNNIGVVYYNRGDYEYALYYYREALIINERVFGSDHPLTALINNNMAVVYQNRGEKETAQTYYNHANDINKKMFGLYHPQTALTYSNYATYYEGQGDYDTASELYSSALAIDEKVLGADHPSTALHNYKIATMFYHQGDYEKALNYYRKALPVCERRLVLECHDMMKLYKRIAFSCRKQGDYKQACRYYVKLLKICTKKSGK